jgi:putative acyl-CoA dehydrogenase
MECLGGNGYVEESILPRLYREAPVNAIWEGPGNVMCLDVMRAFSREREAARAVLKGLVEKTAGLPGAAEASAFIDETVLKQPDAERVARQAVETLALLAAAAALNAIHSNNAALFAAVRLNFTRGRLYGAADINQHESGRLLDRALS